MRGVRLLAAVIMLVTLAACETANSVALRIGGPPAEGAVKRRSVETRRFATPDEGALLSASIDTLQDLGFAITESSSEIGVLTGSKQRDATEAGQVAGAVLVGLLLGAQHMVWDTHQTIQVTLAIAPVRNARQSDVRIVFDRIVTDSKEQRRGELIGDPQIYQQFFDKLAQAVFLEAQKI